MRTKLEFIEALDLKRNPYPNIAIAAAKMQFPHISAYDKRFHKDLYEKMFTSDFAKALKKIETLSKEGCINAIINICKEYEMTLDFVRIILRNNNSRVMRHDIPRIIIGKKEFVVYPLGLKNGLIGVDDLGEFGQGAVLIIGNVSVMTRHMLQIIIRKKYYAYDIRVGSFSDESKLLSVPNGKDKWTLTTISHQSLLPDIAVSSPLGIDFSDPDFNSVAPSKQGVSEMSELAHGAIPKLSSDRFNKMIKIKFHSQVNDDMQPMSIGMPTTALPASVELYFSHRERRILNEQQAKIWDDASFVFKKELNTLGVDIIICIDNSMTSNYYSHRYLLSERFKTILGIETIDSKKKIKYLYSDSFALPSRITAHNMDKNALTKLNAAVQIVEKLTKEMGKKIAIQNSVRNESAALVRAALLIKQNLTIKNRDKLLIFKQVTTPSGSINAPAIVEFAVARVREADSFAFSDLKHIQLLTRYSYKLIFEGKQSLGISGLD